MSCAENTHLELISGDDSAVAHVEVADCDRSLGFSELVKLTIEAGQSEFIVWLDAEGAEGLAFALKHAAKSL